MRFYQTLRFRFTASAVLLVTTVAFALTWWIQHLDKRVLRNHEVDAQLDETSIRFREVAAEIQVLRADVVALANRSAIRSFQYAKHLVPNPGEQKDLAPAPPDTFRPKAEAHFEDLLKQRPAYLRIAYYLDRTKTTDLPLIVRSREGLSDEELPPALPDPGMIDRARRTDSDVSFSGVRVWEGEGKKSRVASLQACFPIVFSSTPIQRGLVVITVDFEHWTRILTRSPRHLVFLAGSRKNLLMYPRPGQPAYQILSDGESDTKQHRDFTTGWLTNEAGLEPLSFAATVPVLYRYSPGEFEDDRWTPEDLKFLLLRYRVGERILSDKTKREELTATLQEVRDGHPTLVADTQINPANDEILVRGWQEDAADLAEVRSALQGRFGADLALLGGKPISCKRFIRNLYKFSFAPRPETSEAAKAGEAPPPQCLYVAMASPVDAIDAKIEDNNVAISYAVCACVLGAVALAVVGSLLLTRPLDAITAATKRLAEGESDARLPVDDGSEIGVLAHSFSHMAGQIRQRQRDIAEREARLQTILDSAAEAILTVGCDGTVQSFNRAAERLFGYAGAEIVGHHLSRLVEDRRLAASDAEAAERLADRLGEGKLGESTGRRKDGTTFPLEYGGNRVPLQERTLLTLILRDITWRKEAEEAARKRNEELEGCVRERTHELEEANAELAQARDEAEHVSVAKDYFLATVSHELRTPLNHVIGFVQLLEMSELTEDQLRDVGKIHHAADNLLALVNDLLDYQKIVQGALSLEPNTFDLPPWFEDLADSMRPTVAARKNELVVECPAGFGTLYADEKRVRQALTNLLSNAAKFTRAGRVTISTRRDRDAAGDWVVFDVADTGRGMTPEQQSKLFQPFTKLLSRSDNPEGTGLGLALSQKLCRLMGGDLVLSRSEPDGGSTFTVRLPGLPTDRSLPIDRPLVLVAPALSRRITSVLVIDDDPDVRELMCRHLEGRGFVIHLAASGAEGLEMVKKVRPDAITLDVLMPGIDGWGTLAALQADAETAHIPVIMITMLDDRTRGFALGAWEFLPKPISWSRLIDLLEHVEPHTGPVLLVDDDPAMRELAGRTLGQHGWDVFSVENGKAALDAAACRKPVMVLLDLLMPVMDGFEFLEAFRKEPAWREVPVVVLTAKQLTDEDYARLGGSVQKILAKGMSSLVELLREVEWLLRNHRKTPNPPLAVEAGESVGGNAPV